MSQFKWIILGFALGILFMMTLPYWAWGEDESSAWLNIDPAYSIQQHKGADIKLTISQHLTGKWYLTPTSELFAWDTNRDINGVIDLEYHYSDRLTFDAGEGYDNYRFYGEPDTLSHYGHAGVKIRLW